MFQKTHLEILFILGENAKPLLICKSFDKEIKQIKYSVYIALNKEFAFWFRNPLHQHFCSQLKLFITAIGFNYTIFRSEIMCPPQNVFFWPKMGFLSPKGQK